ncbi:Rha family transcriptional regulator [Paenibacillus donghaensis]|uniref:Rha family transcriptional regulator n=1 Tax=Paenibacillus donghaensis TaxID=414771 RepID=UPI001FEBCA63|nr:phage antirepressor KilAC domain-containing protein [Paenibacillus donghaensis]
MRRLTKLRVDDLILENGQLVFEQDGRLVTDSLVLTQEFEKEHKNVVRDIQVQIEKLIEAGEEGFARLNFEHTLYKHEQNGQMYTKVNMTEEGFVIVAMSYITPKAMKAKVKFINEFKRMKTQLNNPAQQYLALSEEDRAIAYFSELKEKKQLQLQVEENKPLVTFAETVLKSKDNILVRELSKIIQDEGINIGEKKLYNKLREWKLILKNSVNNEPSQYAMNQKLFVVEERTIDTSYGEKITKTTKVTPKGQVYIIEKLKSELNN